MSATGGEYYEERAERLRLDVLPDILDGVPIRLLEGDFDKRLSIQRPDPDRLREVADRYAIVVGSLDDFVLNALQREKWQDMPRGNQGRSDKTNRRHIDTLIETKIFPGDIHAGHIRDVQVEAIARSEINPAHINKAAESSGYHSDKESEDHEVYLRTSAELYSGTRSLGFAACLSIITATIINTPQGVALTPRYMGIAFNKNDLLAKSIVAESRAITQYIAAWGIQNPQLQNTRRGTRGRGR